MKALFQLITTYFSRSCSECSKKGGNVGILYIEFRINLENNVHLDEFFKILISKRALRGDFYAEKNRLQANTVQLSGSCT